MTSPLAAEDVRLGMIGTGAMGTAMAHHLIRARGRLAIWSRMPRPDLVELGASPVDTPGELAAHSDAVLVMLPDLPDLERILDGDDGLLAGAEDLLLLIGSTSSPTGVRAMAERLGRQSSGRVRVVDCPVSGASTGRARGRCRSCLAERMPTPRWPRKSSPPAALPSTSARSVPERWRRPAISSSWPRPSSPSGRPPNWPHARGSTSTPCGYCWRAAMRARTCCPAARTASSPVTTARRGPPPTW